MFFKAIIFILSIASYCLALAQGKPYKELKVIEYEFQEPYDFSPRNLDSIANLLGEEKGQLWKSKMQEYKKHQEEMILLDTSSYSTLVYEGRSEPLEVIINGDTIKKERGDFKEEFGLCGLPDTICQILTIPRVKREDKKQGEEAFNAILKWSNRRLFAKLRLDFSYSKIRIIEWLDAELVEFTVEGKDGHDFPPKETSVKMPDQIKVRHYNWD